ncbi:MAG: hypothetical protein II577_06195, partial [Erysipelotrichaceae bacterium]|nr:hypothetical protein [Erysipelotrichaceae bacterium]
MLEKYLKSRIPDAKRLVAELRKHYDYASVLGNYVKTKQIAVSTHSNSIDEIDNECGFVVKVYKDGRYAEYSCNDIRDLKAKDVIKAVKLDEVLSGVFKVAMLEEKEHVEDYLREDPSNLSDRQIMDRLTVTREKLEKSDERVINVVTRYSCRQTSKIFVSEKKC